MEPVNAEAALGSLLSAPHEGNVWTGFDVRGWAASIWILHAMYETDELPSSMTYDEERRIERDAGVVDEIPPVLEGVLEDAVATGGGLGPSSAPGGGWRRLRWLDLAERLGSNPLGRLPSYKSFPFTSWPVNIRPPSEGSLDREQLERLCEHLGAASGADSPCYVFFARLPSGRLNVHDEEPLVYQGSIAEILPLYDEGELGGGPTNIWSSDRAWFVYTDWDLWGTKVSGSPELIRQLREDSELEAVELALRAPRSEDRRS